VWEACSGFISGQIYDEDAVLDYPQSGERIRGRQNTEASRIAQPNKKRFVVRRMVGAGDLWVTEFTLFYDGQPSYAVSIMEFKNGKVVHETQYFGSPFEPGSSRAKWVELFDRNVSVLASEKRQPTATGTASGKMRGDLLSRP